MFAHGMRSIPVLIFSLYACWTCNRLCLGLGDDMEAGTGCFTATQRLYSLLNVFHVFKGEISHRSAFSYHCIKDDSVVIPNNPRTGMCDGRELKIYRHLHIYGLE